jgi:hypothetical protein
MQDRRREIRCKVDAPAEITPLATVSTRLTGQVINVSSRGVRIRVDQPLTSRPRVGDVYRVLSSDDRILCEIIHWLSNGESTDIGFRIVHWSDRGQLNHIVETGLQTNGRYLRELNLPGLPTRQVANNGSTDVVHPEV